jgi:hypothetical protein
LKITLFAGEGIIYFLTKKPYCFLFVTVCAAHCDVRLDETALQSSVESVSITFSFRSGGKFETGMAVIFRKKNISTQHKDQNVQMNVIPTLLKSFGQNSCKGLFCRVNFNMVENSNSFVLQSNPESTTGNCGLTSNLTKLAVDFYHLLSQLGNKLICQQWQMEKNARGIIPDGYEQL